MTTGKMHPSAKDVPTPPTDHSGRTVAQLLKAPVTIRQSLTPALIRLYVVLVPACLVICVTNGYDGSLLNGLQGVQSWNDTFGNPRGAILGFMSSSYPLGGILSTPFSAVISDYFGRRYCIALGSAIMVVGSIMQAVANNIGLFVGGRAVVGFGVTLALATGPVLISELAHPRHRVFFTAIYNTSFYFGSLLAAWTTYGSYRIDSSWAWRLPTLIQAFPALLQGFAVLCLPESPRWLVYKEKADEAYAILLKYHASGDEADPILEAEFREIRAAIRTDMENKSQGLKLLIKTPANRKRCLILVCLAVFGQWSGNNLISYYLAKILRSVGYTTQEQQTVLNGALQTTNYATGLAAAIMTTRVPRRKMFLGGAVAMFITFSALASCIAVYAERGNSPAAGKAGVAMIFVYYTAFNICLNPLMFLYPTEILPFRIRAMGMSLLVFVNKSALFFNQFVNPIGLDNIGWKYYIVFVCWLLVEIVIIYFLFPETLGYSLEDSGKAFSEEIDGHLKTTEDEEKDPYTTKGVGTVIHAEK